MKSVVTVLSSASRVPMRMAALGGLLSAVLLAPAAAASGDDSHDARIKAATEMVDVCGERGQIEAYFERTANMTVGLAHHQISNLSDDEWKKFSDIVQADLKGNIDSYIAFTIEEYAQYYAVSDMAAVTEFCRTPAGRKVSDLRTRMETETYDLRERFLRDAVTHALTDAQQKLQSEVHPL